MASRLIVSAIAGTAIAALTLSSVTAASAGEFTTQYHSPTTAGETVYFAGYYEGLGVELFATDGTAEGTRLVKDLCEGYCDAFTEFGNFTDTDLDPQFTTIGEQTFFVANTWDGYQLWVTDGTESGTTQLTHEQAIRGSHYGAYPQELTAHNGILYFSGEHETLRRELWKSDGTVEGTEVIDLVAGGNSSFPFELTEAEGTLFFVSGLTSVRKRDADLWKVEEGAPVRSRVITAETEGTVGFSNMLSLGDGRVVYDLENFETPGSTVWVSDGTDAGTEQWDADGDDLYEALVFDGQPVVRTAGGGYSRVNGPTGGLVAVKPAEAIARRGIFVEGGKLWFFGRSEDSSDDKLWSLDSFESDWVLVDSIPRPLTPGVSADFANGTLWFWHGGKLYSSDGSTVTFVADPGLYGKRAVVSDIAAANGFAVATAEDIRDDAFVWLTDGTAEGTEKVLPLKSFEAPYPTIVGAAFVGTKLGARVGTWGPEIPTLTYQWFANGDPIAGATGKYFTLTTAERGKYVAVEVTGTRDGYWQTTRGSYYTDKVLSKFTTAPTPTVSGSAIVGRTLTATAGTWSPSATLSYRWYANGVALRGATSRTYTIPSSMVGKKLSVKVTARKTNFVTTSRSSLSTAAVR